VDNRLASRNALCLFEKCELRGKKQPRALKNSKLGKYQQAPTDGIKDLNASADCSAIIVITLDET